MRGSTQSLVTEILIYRTSKASDIDCLLFTTFCKAFAVYCFVYMLWLLAMGNHTYHHNIMLVVKNGLGSNAICFVQCFQGVKNITNSTVIYSENFKQQVTIYRFNH